MKKNLLKLVSSSLLLAITVSACGTSTSNLNNINQLQQNPAISALGFESPSVEKFIADNTIEQTEWGYKSKILPASKTAKKFTMLSYLGFDNDKGAWRQELNPMINTHEAAGSSNALNLLLQTDGAEKQDMKRYYVVNDTHPHGIFSPYTQFKYERDSADFRVLRSFIRWGFSTYKSQYKILDINTHGAAFAGVVVDEGTRNMISLPNLNRAVKESAGKLDILTFDACLMSTVEVGYELKDTANIMIGSQDSTLNTGMLYASNLTEILDKSRNLDEVAKNIVLKSDRFGKELYGRTNKKGKIPNVYTISAFRGQQMNDVAKNINNLSKILLSNAKFKNAAKVAINGTHPFYIDEDGSQGQRDLYEVLDRIEDIVQDKNVKAAVLQTRKALNKAIIISRSHRAEKYAKGLAINISPVSVSSRDYQDTRFAKDTLWDELINQINN